jgi:hypothetical protein
MPRSSHRLLIVLALAALACAVAAVPTAAAPDASTGHRCRLVNVRPNHLAALATVLRVNGMSCKRARGVVRKRHPRSGGDRFHVGGRFRLGAFSCRVYHHLEEDTRARCTHRRQAFRVDYGS